MKSGDHLSWKDRYSAKHALLRVTEFPLGIVPPTRVRIYRRAGHFVLQWWDPREKGNLCERINGDFVAAIHRAREVEQRLQNSRTSAPSPGKRSSHQELVSSFTQDLDRRANAAEISVATVSRYRTALQHYLAFNELPDVAKNFPHIATVNRQFRLDFSAFLGRRLISPNGCAGHGLRTMRGQSFVLDTVRAAYEWAADPERGRLLPEVFRNPFRRHGEAKSVLYGDPLAEPDITIPMAIQLLKACDWFQLRLFVPMILFGLRAAEPCYLFCEYVDSNWFRVPCNDDLGYRTKGRRDKRFPLLEDLRSFWDQLKPAEGRGLLYVRRHVHDETEKVLLRGAGLGELVKEFRSRYERFSAVTAHDRSRLRDSVIHDAGGLSYDHIQGEFDGLVRRLGWPRTATLKDLRHLFATTINNAAMPEPYRRYLMGQSLGRSAITAYTHLNKLESHYRAAICSEWADLVEAVKSRLCGLSKSEVG